MKDLKINQEFKKLIPQLLDEEFKQLEKNCIKEGIRDAILLWNDFIIDGHNRYEIAKKNNLDFKTISKDFKDENQVKEWMILNQFGRRNLSNYQRSVLALQLEDVFKEKAKKNLKVSGEMFGKGLVKSPNPIQKINTREEIAKIAQVGDDTIKKVKTIEAKAPEEVKEKLRAGEVSINQVYQGIKREEKKVNFEQKKVEFTKQKKNGFL